MKNYWITIGAVFGFLGVAIGAFGAHQLRNIVTPEMLEIFKTGVQYHLIHAVIITAIGFYGNPKFFLTAFFFSIGIILFSFSLYFYILTMNTPIAIITPFGGISFLIGWLLIIIASIKKEK